VNALDVLHNESLCPACRRALSRSEDDVSNVPQPDQPEEDQQPEPDDVQPDDDDQADAEAG